MEVLGKILKVTTEDGLELDAVLAEPSQKTDKIIIHFHGKEGDFLQNHFIKTMMDEYPKHGFSFMTASHRGKSYLADILRKSAAGFEYTQMGSAYDIFEDCVYDIEAWVNLASQKDYRQIFLQQHSSPQKILWYYNQKKFPLIKGFIIISPSDWAYLFEKYVPEVEKNLALAKKLISEGKSKQLMPINLWSNCPVSAKTFFNWGKKDSNFQLFNFSHPERGFKYFEEITLPMIAILAENDFAVGLSSKKCLKMLEENTNSINFTTKVIKNAAHSYLGYEKELTNTIVKWLKKTFPD